MTALESGGCLTRWPYTAGLFTVSGLIFSILFAMAYDIFHSLTNIYLIWIDGPLKLYEIIVEIKTAASWDFDELQKIQNYW